MTAGPRREIDEKGPWTDDEIIRLRELWDTVPQIGTAEIARRLNRSKNAIVGKAHRLDLAARPSPIRYGGKADGATVKQPRPMGRPLSTTPDERERVKLLHAAGRSDTAIAESLGIGRYTVTRILGPRFVRTPAPKVVATPKPAQAPAPAPKPEMPPEPAPPPIPRPPAPPRAARPCLYPINGAPTSSGRPTYLDCGEPIERGSFCAEHARLCYSKAPVRARADEYETA
jgi:GcrA cell cycle regulator